MLACIPDIFYLVNLHLPEAQFCFQYLDGIHQEAEAYNDPSLVHYAQRQLQHDMNASSGLE